MLVLVVAAWSPPWSFVVAAAAPRRRPSASAEDARREDLEAAKEAKYREIRDAELDHRTGKLSEADHRALDRQLRAEAIEILRDRRSTHPLGGG